MPCGADGGQAGRMDPIPQQAYLLAVAAGIGLLVGIEREWGYFCLSELESVDINGIKVCRDEDHFPRPLSECLQKYGLIEN